MSEVTSSIEEPTPSVRVDQRLMKYRQPMTHRMLWLMMVAGVVVLAGSDGAAVESNGTVSEPPVELTSTTEAPPPREAVTDLFKAPLGAFKVQVPLSPGDEEEIAGLPLGKAENSSDSAPTPPFSNLWFNAGQSLGSAANSLTGWLNRLGPQTTSTTTRPPEVVVRVQSHQVSKKPLITIDGKRKTQGNRISPVVDDDADANEDEDDDEDEENDYEDGEEEQGGEEEEVVSNSNSNRYSSNNDEEDSNENANEEEEEAEDEEEEEEETEPAKKRKTYKKKNSSQNQRQPPRNNRKGYDYDEEEEDDYDDDEDYDYDVPNTHSGRQQQQQQQSFLNRFRQLAKFPYSSSNKQKNGATTAGTPGFRPVRIVQNGQVLQLVQDPTNQPGKRRKRPSPGQGSFQLIPIRNNQLPNAGGQKQRRRKIKKPDTTNQIVIPIPQGLSSQNSQKRPSQYITIPWAKLGINSPQQDYAQNGQQAAPIIVNIPQQLLQQNSNRRRRPAQPSSQTASKPLRKRLRRPLQNHKKNGHVITRLTEQNIRDMFRVPEIPPSRTPQEENQGLTLGGKRKRPAMNNEMQSDELATVSPDALNSQQEAEVEVDDDNIQDDGEPYIVVGDEESNDEALPRHAMSKRFMHIGGMKPYVDVLNEGRYFLKSGRQMQLDPQTRPESRITSIKPKKSVTADITTESSSETNANAPPTILLLGSEDISTTGNPLLQ